MKYALGKKPASPRPTDLKLSKYAVDLPKLPKRFGFGFMFRDWQMLGNDRYGDCVWAGAAHETMLWNHVARRDATFDDQVVLGDYSAVTGFDPNDPSTDQGTDVHAAMAYRKATGIADAAGARHTIDAYVSVDPVDFDLTMKAVYVFGATGVGFNFPDSADQQFRSGQPWDVVAGATVVGGHYTPAVGSTDTGGEITVVTWAKRQPMTRAFFDEYVDEVWVPLSLEVLRSGFGLHHLDVDQLRADLAAL